VNADIVIPDYSVVIEFDGSQYHRGAEAAARDTRQTQALEAAGWQVIRVRPAPLESLGPNDVVVPDGRDTKAVTTAVLQRLKGLGHTPARADDYHSDPNLWAVAKADEEIQMRFSRSISSLFPEIAAEWHPTLNGDRRPKFTSPVVALLTPLRWAIRSIDALRWSSSCISSMAADRRASGCSSLRGRPRPRLGVIPPVSYPLLVQR
jgi:hypothetical protein